MLLVLVGNVPNVNDDVMQEKCISMKITFGHVTKDFIFCIIVRALIP